MVCSTIKEIICVPQGAFCSKLLHDAHADPLSGYLEVSKLKNDYAPNLLAKDEVRYCELRSYL